MKKISFIIFIILIFISGCSSNITKVCLINQSKCFDVEIADTSKERESGLMNRTFLNKDKGMLFVFEKYGSHEFWMKNTLIPLDIIWIDDNKIVFIKENALPCNTFEKSVNGKQISNCEIFTPDKKANYVLEINSGLVKELNIKVGDIIRI